MSTIIVYISYIYCMTKQQALKILNDYIDRNINLDNHFSGLPIVDKVIYWESTSPNDITNYTFTGLIKIAYGL